MPFLRGPAPIRRTLQYLDTGKLLFKDRVRVMEVHYNMFFKSWHQKPKYSDPHIGLREFYFWHIPQIQYKNPQVQIVRFLEMTPLPFVRCWLEDGRDVLFDCDSKSKDDILSQITKTLGKTRERLELEARLTRSQQNVDNPAIFGFNRDRFCICEIPDQVPCPGVIRLPKGMRGKFRTQQKEELEAWENDLDAKYDCEKRKRFENHWFPSVIPPIMPRVEGLEKIHLRKPKQRGLIKDMAEHVKKLTPK